MSEIIKHKKGDKEYSVQEHLKGKRSEYSLCWQGCKKFKPDDVTNCPIAQDLFMFSIMKNVTTAVWDCASYEKKSQK